jgi:hypothetical protein
VPRIAVLVVPLLFLACDREPLTPNVQDVAVFDVVAVNRPIQWTILDLPCPEGTTPLGGQLQSAQPLDPAGDHVLVGTSCQAENVTLDWFVYDISSGSAVLVDAVDSKGVGYHIGAHSPVNSRIGFGVVGNALTIYDDGFREVELPADVWGIDVWAASARAVWIAGSTVKWDAGDLETTGGPGKIVRFDGEEFVVEHDGGSPVLDVWGNGESALFASTITGILRRNRNGTWTAEELPENCGTTWATALDGLNPRDVWATRSTCMLHFDGKAWSTVQKPVSGTTPSPVLVDAVLPLSANALLIGGQASQLLQAGPDCIALWGSVDRGQSWTLICDPVFDGPLGSGFRSFFGMGTTQGTQRIFLPTIAGRRLFVGTPMDFAAISQRRAARGPVGVGEEQVEIIRD